MLVDGLLAILAAAQGAATAGPPADGAFAFANTFQSGMVVQRDAPLHVWGWGDCNDNEPVTIKWAIPGCGSLGCNSSATIVCGAWCPPTLVCAETPACCGPDRRTPNPRGSWSAVLPPMAASAVGGVLSLHRGGGGGLLGTPTPPSPLSPAMHDSSMHNLSPALLDVVVGDVILISGQSNVGISVSYSNQFNASAQAFNLAEATRIGSMVRLTSVHMAGRWGPSVGCSPSDCDPAGNDTQRACCLSVEQVELGVGPECKLPSAQCAELGWARANATNVPGFSALGWYLARELFALQHERVPIGIVQSDVPGTPIQKWTPHDQISACYNGTAHAWPSYNGTLDDASLYNTMIHPFVYAQLAFSAVVWYQGESNTGPSTNHTGDKHGPMNGQHYYACALPTMAAEWRRRLGHRSTTGSAVTGARPTAELPVFVVELAAYCNQNDESTFMVFCDANTTSLTGPDYHLPEMRMAQAAVLGLADSYVVSAMDLGSLHPLPYASIHPTNKLEVARRLALGMQHALLGDQDVVYRGPTPLTATAGADGSVTIAFETQSGARGLAFDAKAGCTNQVLNVYCRRNTFAGFEIQTPGGAWEAPASVHLDGLGSIDTRCPDAGCLGLVVVPDSGATAVRVRYAMSDWPVVSVRNAVGGLPARVFDLGVGRGTR